MSDFKYLLKVGFRFLLLIPATGCFIMAIAYFVGSGDWDNKGMALAWGVAALVFALPWLLLSVKSSGD